MLQYWSECLHHQAMYLWLYSSLTMLQLHPYLILHPKPLPSLGPFHPLTPTSLSPFILTHLPTYPWTPTTPTHPLLDHHDPLNLHHPLDPYHPYPPTDPPPWIPSPPGRVLCTVLVTIPWAGPPSLIDSLMTDNQYSSQRSGNPLCIKGIPY